MLPTIADFPHPGAIAWLSPADGHGAPDQVRILEHDAARGTLIAYQKLPPVDPALRKLGAGSGAFHNPASGNTRVDRTRLFATRDDAIKPPTSLQKPQTSRARPEGSRAIRAKRRSAR